MSRRLKRRRRRRWFLVLLGFFLLRSYHDATLPRAMPTRDIPLRDGKYRVTALIDPITFVCLPADVVESRQTEPLQIVVRLIGLRPHQGPREFQRRLAQEALGHSVEFVSGRPVHLRFDRQRFDERDRALAYLSVNGESLNANLLELGLFRFEAIPGNSATRQRRLERAANVARRHRRGYYRTANVPLAGKSRIIRE